MPIASGDIHYRLSGGAANSDPLLSLGGAKSSVQVTTGTLFDDVSGAQSALGLVEYRCVYIHNNHGSLTLTAPKIYVQTNTPTADTTIDLALGTSATNAQEQGPLATEETAPSGVSWVTNATNYATGIALSDIPFGQHRAVWLRRTVNAGAAAYADSYTIRVEGDTAP
jgi:hypothetical protein